MRLRSLGLAAIASVMLSSGAALAIPTTTIGGVTIPNGVVPGGFYVDSEISFENLITGPSQQFFGVFRVNTIQGSDPLSTITYSYGLNGTYLYGVFDGFTSTTVQAPAGGNPGKILFSGGSIRYYVSDTDNFTIGTSGGGLAAQLAAKDKASCGAGSVGSCQLWLGATPGQIDGAGNTLEITIPGNGTLNSFSGASAGAVLDVNAGAAGGIAGFAFDTNTFLNSYTGLAADIDFRGSATSGASGAFDVSGNNQIKANIFVPEPMTLSLFGAGLAGVAAFGARRRKKA